MEKLLICSGDSFTDPGFRSASHPEMDTSWPKWPEIMAKELGMKCINLGRSGSGNEYIYSSIQDVVLKLEDKSQIGLIVAGWSQGFRRDYQICNMGKTGTASWHMEWNEAIQKGDPFEYDGKTHYMDKENYFVKDSLVHWQEEWVKNNIHERKALTSIQKAARIDGWTNERVDPFGDIQGWVRRSLRFYVNLQMMCELYNIPYLQTQMIPLYIDYLRGLGPTEQEIELGKTRENDTIHYNDDPFRAKTEIQKIILEYDGVINEKRFIGWPISREIGGYPLNMKELGNWDDEGNEFIISEYDNHPTRKGQEKIAQALLEKYYNV
tara:strand:- start:2101 stop:3069 length:969 start_codon:yes stop_codon:yes gene_type:complete